MHSSLLTRRKEPRSQRDQEYDHEKEPRSEKTLLIRSSCIAIACALLASGFAQVRPSNAAQSTQERAASVPGVKKGRSVAGAGFPASLAGRWQGIVHVYPKWIYVEMDFDSEGEGVSRFQPLVDYLDKRSLDSDINAESLQIAGKLDPITRTCRLSLRERPRNIRLPMPTVFQNLEGYLDAENGMVAGVIRGGKDFCVFARPERFEELLGRFAKFRSPRPGPFPANLMKQPAEPTRVTIEKLVDWTSRLRKEFPDLDVMRISYGKLEQFLVRLFDDELFSAYFGKPFDKLSIGELVDVVRLLREARRSRDRNIRDLGVFENMFTPMGGTGRAPQTTMWVNARRILGHWRDDHLQAIERMEPANDVLERLEKIAEAVRKTDAAFFWPSDAPRLESAIAAAKNRKVLPRLESEVAAMEAEAPSLALLQKLSQWSGSQAKNLQAVSGPEATALQERVQTKLRATIIALMPEEIAKLDRLGNGIKALENGLRWRNDFSATFGKRPDSPEYRQALERFSELRRRHLDEAKPEMLSQIETLARQATDEISESADEARIVLLRAISQRIKDWFALPEDHKHPVAQEVVEKANRLTHRVANQLPPRKRGQAAARRIAAANEAERSPKYGRAKISRGALQLGVNGQADNDPHFRWLLPAPVVEAGFDFRSNVCWAIFNGRFDEIDQAIATGSGFGSRVAAAMSGENPRFHFAFITYVGVASAQYGENQIYPATRISWRKWTEDQDGNRSNERRDENPVYISGFLEKFYEESYRLATKAADADGLFGNNLFGYFETLDKMMKGGFLSQAGRRADGEFAMVQAGWERNIISDIRQLFETWPQGSIALWQFEENVRRRLNKQPSLQALFDKTLTAEGFSSLHLAARRNDPERMTELLAAGAKVSGADRDGRTPLHLAALGNAVTAIDLLLRHGAKLDARDTDNAQALHFAGRGNSAEAIDLLAKCGADVNARASGGITPLHRAAHESAPEAVESLLKSGARIDQASDEGSTALHLASASGAEGVVNLLLAAGANPGARDRTGRTPLHLAAAANRAAVVNQLVARGADLHATLGTGETPLHLAARAGAIDVIEPLLLRGANPNAKTRSGKTPLDEAISSNNEKVIRALRVAQAGK